MKLYRIFGTNLLTHSKNENCTFSLLLKLFTITNNRRKLVYKIAKRQIIYTESILTQQKKLFFLKVMVNIIQSHTKLIFPPKHISIKKKDKYTMILSDKTILHKLHTGEITIEPYPTNDAIQPSSIDLRLSNEFLLPHIDTPIDIKNGSPRYEPLKCNVLQLPPKAFVLGTTIEKIKIPPNLIGRVEGRSSIGRLGITIHITAGFIDAGFEGQITLEIANLSNNTIMLYENMRICQIVFEEIDAEPNRTYGQAGNKYQGQTGVTGSLIYYDDDTDKYGVTK